MGGRLAHPRDTENDRYEGEATDEQPCHQMKAQRRQLHLCNLARVGSEEL
jgi:hypothetical protein